MNLTLPGGVEVIAGVPSEVRALVPWLDISGPALKIGPYEDQGGREENLAKTFGSSEFLWEQTDEIRFDRSTRRLNSLLLAVPEVEVGNSAWAANWKAAPIMEVGIAAVKESDFAIEPAQWRWRDADGGRLLCFYADAEPGLDGSRLEVCPGFRLLTVARQIIGWEIECPARFLCVRWWESDRADLQDVPSKFLAEYLDIVQGVNIERMQDADPAIRSRLEILVQRIRSRDGCRGQRSALHLQVQELLDYWYSP